MEYTSKPEKNWRMSTCNRLDLQTPKIMPKNLPIDHWLGLGTRTRILTDYAQKTSLDTDSRSYVGTMSLNNPSQLWHFRTESSDTVVE